MLEVSAKEAKLGACSTTDVVDVGREFQVAGELNSKVGVVFYFLEDRLVEKVKTAEFLPRFRRNRENIALFCVERHSIDFCPFLKMQKIVLKGEVVVDVPYCTIK